MEFLSSPNNNARKTDTDDILRKCFEFDWANNKITKFIKNDGDRDSIKQLLWEQYGRYKDCYRHYASFTPLGTNYNFRRRMGATGVFLL